MDPRLAAAVAESRAWYADVFSAHGVPYVERDGVWVAQGAPPPWHSAVKTTRPGVTAEVALAAMGPFDAGSVADSFGDLDLGAHGFRLLIDAVWFHQAGAVADRLPAGWSVVAEPDRLAAWNLAHDYVGVLLPELLADAGFVVLARHDGVALTGGTVLHDAPGDDASPAVVGISNWWGAGWAELLSVAAAVRPGAPLVGYTEVEDLPPQAASLGPQRVWVR